MTLGFFAAQSLVRIVQGTVNETTSCSGSVGAGERRAGGKSCRRAESLNYADAAAQQSTTHDSAVLDSKVQYRRLSRIT
jgi:hypothetical protein